MKKILTALLAVMYIGMSSGIAMEIHYCMGTKSGVDFYAGHNGRCSKCGMKDKKGCCKDEHRFYKLTDSHKNVFNSKYFSAYQPVFSTPIAYYNLLLPANIVSSYINNNSPPTDTKPSAYILNCVFRL